MGVTYGFILAIHYGVLSLVTLLLYGWDKRTAIRGTRRVRERTLHLWAVFGGWPGAWLAQRWFRHKSQKVAFRRIFWLTVLVNVAGVIGLGYYGLHYTA